MTAEGVQTDFRFCKTREFDEEMVCTAAEAITDDWLDVAEDADSEDWREPYHRIIVSRLGSTEPVSPTPAQRANRLNTDDLRADLDSGAFWDVSRSNPARGRSQSFDYVNRSTRSVDVKRSYRMQWRFEADYWHWFDSWDADALSGPVNLSGYDSRTVASDKWSEAPAQLIGPERLDGTLWNHAQTDIGTSRENVGTGVHGDELANTHVPMAPVQAWLSFHAPPELPIFDDHLLWPIRHPGIQTSRLVPTILYPHPAGVGFIDPASGKAIDASPILGAGLAAALMEPGARWVTQSEPLAAGDANPLAGLVLSEDGMQVRDIVAVDGVTLTGLAQLERVESSRDEAGTASGAMRTLAASGAALLNTTLPAPLFDFEAFYARSIDRVFVVGGVNEDGSQNPTVFVAKPGVPFTELPFDSDLGKVHAATYEPASGKLFVLDEVPGWFFSSRARLLTVDPATGRSHVVGQWPMFGLFDDFHLVADRNGKLLLASSSAERARHMIVRLDAESLAVEAVMPRDRALAFAPVVAYDGYQIATVRKNGRMKLKTRKRIETKAEREYSGLLSHIGTCF